LFLLKRLLRNVENNGFIPNNQFGFTERKCTKKTHRIEAFECKDYFSAAFLYISQALEAIWQTGLLCKFGLLPPLNCFILLKCRLHGRHIRGDETEYTELSSVSAGIYHLNVPGLLLFLQYTADLPTSTETKATKFADGIAVLANNNFQPLLHKN
jgi:hypothetical protein